MPADIADIRRLEAQARAMAMVFGIDPDQPYPSAVREELQRTQAFQVETWDQPIETPAWRILARELALTQDLHGEAEF